MRDPGRIRPLMERLVTAWLRYPDLRLGQIVSNASPERGSFDIEDESLVREVERQLGGNRRVGDNPDISPAAQEMIDGMTDFLGHLKSGGTLDEWDAKRESE